MSEDKKEALKKRIEGIAELKTISSVIRDIIRLSADDNATVEDFEKVISRDFAIAGKLMTIANSPFYGFSRQIKTIGQAIVVLGFDMVKGLALATAVLEDISGNDRKRVLNFWRHSFDVAAAANIIAKRTERVNNGAAFLAGLMHDVGRPIFYMFYGNAYMDDSVKAQGSLMEMESRNYGATHQEAGAWFADKCRMPTDMVEAIRHHHSPEAAMSRLSATVYAADLVASTGLDSFLCDSLISPRHSEVLGLIGLDGAGLDAMKEELDAIRVEMEPFYQ